MPLSKGEQLTQTLLEYNNLKSNSTQNRQTSLNRGSTITKTLVNNLGKQQAPQENNANVVERGFSTVGNVINQVIRGASKGLEGIYDFGANLVGAIGGAFGAKDFQQDVAEHTKFNWTDWWYNQSNMVETEQKAYTNDFVNGVASSIGQMLPSIAIGVATGGTSTAAQAASLGTFGVGAAGNATETALNEGATTNQALGYGLLSGAKEVGTELVGGKVLSGILGSTGRAFGVIGNRTTNQVTKTTGLQLVKRFAKDAIEEGSEEALGDLLEPLIQQVYKDGSYTELFEENGGVQALLEDFAAGALTSGIMQGVSMGVNVSQYGYTNYKLAQDIEILKTMQEQAQQEYFRGNNEAGDRILEERSNIIKRMQGDLIETLNRYQIASNYRRANITEGISQELAYQEAINTRGNIILEGLRNDITSNIGTTRENYSYYNPDTRRIVLRERDLSNIEKTKENLIHEYTHSVSNQDLIDTVINNMNEVEYQNKLETYTQRYANVIRQSSEYRNLLEQGYSINEAFNQVAENYVREEIAADEMNKYFSNISEFKQAIKGSTKKGFSKLLNNIRALYRNKSKPNGYSEVVKLLQTNINRINKTAETKAKTKETKYKLQDLSPQQQELFVNEDYVKKSLTSEETIKVDVGDVISLMYPSFERNRVLKGYINAITTKTDAYAYKNENGEIVKVTPNDSWLLMGFTQEQYNLAAEVVGQTALQKQAGNSIVVPELESIVNNLKLDKTQPIKLEEYFAGIGAIRSALVNQGYIVESVGVVENDYNAVTSYNALYNENVETTDIRKYASEVEKHDVDLLLHGSPCQSNSKLNNSELKGMKQGSNTKSSLLWNSVEAISKVKPKIVIWENVANVLENGEIRETFNQYLEVMESLGYKNYTSTLNAINFGIPQTRNRVFTVSRLDNEIFEFPKGNSKNTPKFLDYLKDKKDNNITKIKTNEDIRYKLDDGTEIERNEMIDLNYKPNQTATAYKVFVVKNGKLYPPMVANPNASDTPVGVWLHAQEGIKSGTTKTGRQQVQAGGKGTSTGKQKLAYRPGWHLGDIPLATQFSRTDSEGNKTLFPKDFVWAECEYPIDINYQEEAMSYGYNKNGNFQHSLAGLPRLPKSGYYKYRTNPNPNTVPWVITGEMKVKRILTDAETDEILKANGIEPLKRQGGRVDNLSQLGIDENINQKIADIELQNEKVDSDIRYRLDNEIMPNDVTPPTIREENKITTPNVESRTIEAQELENILPDAEYVYDLRKEKEKANIKKIFGDLNRNWFDAQVDLRNGLAKKLQLKTPTLTNKAARYEAEVLIQKLRTAPKIAENFIERGLIDDNGNKVLYGVDEIFKELSQEDYIEFQDYMFHMHNIDRMTIEERIIPKRQDIIDQRKKDLELNERFLEGYKQKYKSLKSKNIPEEDKVKINDLQTSISNLRKEIKLREGTIKKIKNKPVFGSEYTADYSRKFVEKQLKVKDYATKFPELAQKIYDINNYILEESVKSGRLSTQERDLFKDYYPHYVPTYRPLKPQSIGGSTITENSLLTKSYKEARGSNEPLIALDLQLKRYIMQNIKANSFNDLGTALLYGEFTQPNRIVWETREDLPVLEENLNDDIKPIVEEKDGNFTLSILSNGLRITRNVTKEEFIGLQDLQKSFDILAPSQDFVFKTLNKIMRLFKSSVTTLNPFFLIRNLSRDVQDALIYTKYGTANFIKMSAKALKEMQSRDTYFKLFRQYGGFSNSIFDSGESIYNSLEDSEVNKLKKKNPLKWLTHKMELANRAVEILPRYIEFRLSVEAQKKAGIENINYDKAIYDSQEITLNFGKHGASRAAKGLNRYLMPFFNAQLQGVSKIFKTFTNVDGKSIKAFTLLLLKTAILGLVPAVLNRLLYDDDEDYANLSNYEKDNFYLFKVGDDFIKIPKGRVFAMLGSFLNQDNKTLNDNLTSIWDTLSPVSSLRTIIDPIKDATTNTTWYGGNIVSQAYDNVRPSNQYDNTTSYIARGIGKVLNVSPLKVDYVLEQYTGVIGDFVLPILTPKGLSNPKTTVLEPTINQFLIDPDSSSGYSSKFYDLTQELNYQANEDNLQAKAQLRYLNKMKSYINDIYDEIDALEESNLSNKEIENQTKILRGSINVLYKQSIETSEAIRKELNRYEINEDNYDKVYELALYSVLGAESTLKLTNVDLYDRATDLNEVGIDYDTYYTYYVNTKGFDKEYKEEYIQRMNLTRIQKYILYLVSGYSIPDNYKVRLRREIKNSNMSDSYKEKLLAKLE